MLLRPVPDVPVHLGRQREVAVDRACVRVEQQLRRVPAGAGPRVPAAVHPVAVALSGPHPGTKPCQISCVSSVSRTRLSLAPRPRPSKRHSSTASAPPAHSAKFVPATPSGPVRKRAPAAPVFPARPARRAAARHAVRRSPRRRGARVRPRRPVSRPPPPARLRWTPVSLLRLVERRASDGRKDDGKGRAVVPTAAPRRVVLPTVLPTAWLALTFPQGVPVVTGECEARTWARTARGDRSGRRTDMGRTAGRGRRMHLGRRWHRLGHRRDARQTPVGRGRHPRHPPGREQGGPAREEALGAGARRPAGVGAGRQVAGRAADRGPRPDLRGRAALGTGRRAAGPGRQVHRRRGRPGRPRPALRPAHHLHHLRPRRALHRLRRPENRSVVGNRHDRLAAVQRRDHDRAPSNAPSR